MYNWEKFERVGARTEGRITVVKSDAIGFPTKFYEDNKIKDYKYVVLFFDAQQKAIGLHFTNDEWEKNKFTVIHSKDGYGGSINARSFFRFYALDAGKYAGKYDYQKEYISGVGDVIAFKLKENEKRKRSQPA